MHRTLHVYSDVNKQSPPPPMIYPSLLHLSLTEGRSRDMGRVGHARRRRPYPVSLSNLGTLNDGYNSLQGFLAWLLSGILAIIVPRKEDADWVTWISSVSTLLVPSLLSIKILIKKIQENVPDLSTQSSTTFIRIYIISLGCAAHIIIHSIGLIFPGFVHFFMTTVTYLPFTFLVLYSIYAFNRRIDAETPATHAPTNRDLELRTIYHSRIV